jgi:hypothetical protein
MDGNAIDDSPEPLPCPFCGSGADQLAVERWSAEDDPDPSYHVECLKCGSNGPQGATQLEAARDETDDRNNGALCGALGKEVGPGCRDRKSKRLHHAAC